MAQSKTAKISKWITYGGVVSYGSLHLVEDCVYTYDVLIGRLDREDMSARVCTKNFSVTSSGHRNRLLEALAERGLTVTTVDDPEVV